MNKTYKRDFIKLMLAKNKTNGLRISVANNCKKLKGYTVKLSTIEVLYTPSADDLEQKLFKD